MMSSNIFLIVNAFTDHKLNPFFKVMRIKIKKKKNFFFLIPGSAPAYPNVTHCLNTANPANVTSCPHAGLMLVHSLRRRPNIKQALGQCNVFAGKCF